MDSSIKERSEISWLYLTQSLYFFGFFALKSIFVLYLINHHGFSDGQAISLFASYMCLSYGTSLAGSTIADKLLGVKNSILLGGFLSCLGAVCLMTLSAEYICLGLAFLSLGMGLTKPNLHTTTGLYFQNPEDPKKDIAYNISFMVIQIGHTLASVACGAVASGFDWNYGIALVVLSFIAATYLLNKKVNPEQDNVVFSKEKLLISLASVSGIIATVYSFLTFRDHSSGVLGLIVCGSLIYLGWIFYQCDHQERKGMGIIILGLALHTALCSLIEQSGSSITLFVENAVDRNILGAMVPTPVFMSFEPMFLVASSLIYIYVSKRNAKLLDAINWSVKAALGFALLGLGFIILSVGSNNQNALLSPLWVLSSFFLQMMGEVLIAPTILASISKNAPPRYKSIMMGFFVLTIAYGHFIAGFMAQFSVAGQGSHGSFFMVLGLLPLAVAMPLFMLKGRKMAVKFR
ncbi:MAG: MFS transporter [Alphaproteobacteria bacterium]|nr:MFS transporter [Alphaproteobacteria bacterium]